MKNVYINSVNIINTKDTSQNKNNTIIVYYESKTWKFTNISLPVDVVPLANLKNARENGDET